MMGPTRAADAHDAGLQGGLSDAGASKAKLMLGFWEWDLAIRAAHAPDVVRQRCQAYEGRLMLMMLMRGTADARQGA